MDGLNIKTSALPKFTGSPLTIQRTNQPTIIIPQYEYVQGKPGKWPVFMGNVNPDPAFTDRYGFQKDTALVQALLKSYQENKQSGGVDRTLTIDIQHSSSQSGVPATVIGEIVDADIAIEDGSGVVKLFANGDEQTPAAEVGDMWLLATCGFYEDYYQLLKEGKIGFQPSIAFHAEVDAESKIIPDSVVWNNLAVVQIPAVGNTPILALNSKGVQLKADGGVELDMKGVIMDDMTKASLQAALAAKAIPQPDIDIILTISQDGGLALLTLLQVETETEPAAPEASAKTTVEDRVAKLEELVNRLTANVEKSLATTTALISLSSKGGVMLGTPQNKPAFDKAKRVRELVAGGMNTTDAIAKANKEAK